MSPVPDSDSGEPLLLLPGGASGPLVVALLYNTNGMATWCWEAAHALHELGQNVLLIASPEIPLPGIPSVEIVRIEIRDKSSIRRGGLMKAFSTVKSLIAAGSDGSLEQIHIHLAARGVQPAAYILNQSSLVDRSVRCPQIVAAWSYPVSLLGYLRKTLFLASDESLKAFVRTVLSSLGWWRKDWRSYRTADRVLPVTKALLASLLHRSVNADLAYPGACIGRIPDRSDGGIRLLMAAVNLNEPRKRILWMLEAMKKLSLPPGTVLQLAGKPDDSLRRAAAQLSVPAEFLGHLKRQELQKVMQDADIFCFGSQLDDWGYVLVEAMANGLVPVAPAISPFDEIMGQVGFGYNPYSQDAFVSALHSATSSSLAGKRHEAWERANSLFSRATFGRFILESVESVMRLR
jgi:glycosyltransferase involved in cell wall biosynthesis